jgi:hypothetical protein
MDTEAVPSRGQAIEDALRRLVGDPRTRERAVDTIEEAVASAQRPERETMGVLARINRDVLAASVGRLEADGYEYEHIGDDSEEAHRKVADIQRILRSFGFSLGTEGVDGYYGGPPGKPVVLELEEVGKLISRASRNEKLLGARQEGPTESWTRDATRRLQHFLGTVGLPEGSDLLGGCLVQTDGLFGSRTLAGVSAFLKDV